MRADHAHVLTSVCLCIGHNCVLRKNGWTDRDLACVDDSCWPKDARILDGVHTAAMLSTSVCYKQAVACTGTTSDGLAACGVSVRLSVCREVSGDDCCVCSSVALPAVADMTRRPSPAARL